MSRRPQVEGSAPRVPIQTRVPPSLRDRLSAASEESGRSMAQEIELRLERSFDLADITTKAMEAAAAKMFDAMMGISENQKALLLQQCGGDELFLLWQIPAFAIQQVERERGKKIRDDEETCRAAERAVLGAVTDVFRTLPPTYSQWAASIPPMPVKGETFKDGLAALGQAFHGDDE